MSNANVSEESKVSTETAPRPFSTSNDSKLIIELVIYFLVSIIVMSIGATLIVDNVSTVFCVDGIVMLPSVSINTSPNNWNPAG